MRRCHCGAELSKEMPGGWRMPMRSDARTCSIKCRQFRFQVRAKIAAEQTLWPTMQERRTTRVGQAWVEQTAVLVAEVYRELLSKPKQAAKRKSLLGVLSCSWKGPEIAEIVNRHLQLNEEDRQPLLLPPQLSTNDLSAA